MVTGLDTRSRQSPSKQSLTRLVALRFFVGEADGEGVGLTLGVVDASGVEVGGAEVGAVVAGVLAGAAAVGGSAAPHPATTPTSTHPAST
ncbi:hypothetical protein ABZW11_42695 [Nonomuraea sp. NPDC004580]|uniref:hypothetical protein n=1 Tax=Nonomuraea sp. NPDC004580 TaxID=3154552 RepID=UPI0033BE10FB